MPRVEWRTLGNGVGGSGGRGFLCWNGQDAEIFWEGDGTEDQTVFVELGQEAVTRGVGEGQLPLEHGGTGGFESDFGGDD